MREGEVGRREMLVALLLFYKYTTKSLAELNLDLIAALHSPCQSR